MFPKAFSILDFITLGTFKKTSDPEELSGDQTLSHDQ